MPENKWDKYLEKGEQKSKWDKYVVEEDSKKKAQSDSIPVPNISDEVLATGFVSPSSVPSSATLSPLEIPRPQGQSEKVRIPPPTKKPKTIDEAVQADKFRNESRLAGMYNTALGSLSKAVGGAVNFMDLLGSMQTGLYGVERGIQAATGYNPTQVRQRKTAEAITKFIDKARSSASTKEGEQYRISKFDVTNGIGMEDLKALPEIVAQLGTDIGLAIPTGGASFAAQGYQRGLDEIDALPNADKIGEGTRQFVGLSYGIIDGVLEKFALDKILKNSGATKKIRSQVLKEVTDNLVKSGEKKVTKETVQKLVTESTNKIANKLKNAGLTALKGAGIEGGTEALQSGLSAGVKYAANKLEGKEIFDEYELQESTKKDLLNSLVLGGVFGGALGGISGAATNLDNYIKTKVGEAQNEADIQTIIDEVSLKTQSGEISEAEAQEILPKVEQYKEIAKTIPAEVPAQNKGEVIAAIAERQEMEQTLAEKQKEVESTDPAFRKEKEQELNLLTELIEDKNNEIKELASQPIQPEEQITTEEQFKEPIVETVEEESQVIPLQEQQKSQDITLQKNFDEELGNKQIDDYRKEGVFIWENDKPILGSVSIDRFNGENADIFPSQSTVDNAGVKKWAKKIKDGERPFVLVDLDERTDKFRVIDGHTRLAAYESLGIKNIPVIDRNGLVLGKPQEKVEPPVQVKEEVVSETPVSETKQAEAIAERAKITPKNFKDLYKANRELFGLNRVQSFANAVVMDRMIGAMAKRAGVSKEAVYAKLSFQKSSENDLPVGVKMQVDALHGSPYEFDKFSLEKIGTGEGAQAFGWGLYFTDLEDIAKNYAKNLAILEIKNAPKNINEDLNRIFSEVGNPFKGKSDYLNKNELESFLSKASKYAEGESYGRGANRELFNAVDRVWEYVQENFDNIEVIPHRRLYKVSLHEGKTPDQYTWLEWDKKPNKEQVGKLLSKLKQEQIDKGFYYGVKPDATNADVYKGLSKALGGARQASLFLLENGIDGIKYPAESVARGATSDNARGFNYVVFDENAVSIKEVIKFQKDANKARGAAMVTMDGNAIIYALSSPNASTPVHELSHVFEHYITDAERSVINNWAGTKEWTTETSEKFARGFEKYLAEGKAPSTALEKVFAKFKEWLTDIYNGIKGSEIDLELNEQMRDIYAKMLGEESVSKKEPTKSIKDKFKDIADINLSDNPEVVKKREVTKYLKDNPEIADVVKNFEKVTEYLKSEKELKVICD